MLSSMLTAFLAAHDKITHQLLVKSRPPNRVFSSGIALGQSLMSGVYLLQDVKEHWRALGMSNQFPLCKIPSWYESSLATA